MNYRKIALQIICNTNYLDDNCDTNSKLYRVGKKVMHRRNMQAVELKVNETKIQTDPKWLSIYNL
jgi:hypothetical protein